MCNNDEKISEKITVNLSKDYDILLGDGLFGKIPCLIAPFCEKRKILIVTDSTVKGLYGEKLLKMLQISKYETFLFSFAAGEEAKNRNTLFEITDFALKNGFNRNDVFLSLGGGVVGDITGFAASVYMRGISYIQIPTTLLSAVDSSVGGKTAIDIDGKKNILGTFYQPILVICDTEILKNLPKSVFDDGLGEIIKYGVISDMTILDAVLNGKVRENLTEIIKKCLNIKLKAVEPDEFDKTGARKILNAGHTLAHSIEAESGYKISHGKAVAIGLMLEAKISNCLGICNAETVKIIEKAVNGLKITDGFELNPEKTADFCLSDKKNTDSKISFLLPESIGKIKEIYIEKEKLIKILKDL